MEQGVSNVLYYSYLLWKSYDFKPIPNGPFSGLLTERSAKSPTLSKTSHTYPTIMRPGTVVSHPKKTQKSFIFVIHIDLRVTNDSRNFYTIFLFFP